MPLLRRGLIAATAFNRRYDTSHRAVHDRIRAGEIGKVEMIHIVSRTRSLPPPRHCPVSRHAAREKGSHHYDLGPPGWQVPSPSRCLRPAIADRSRLRDYGDLDTAALTLRFDAGPLPRSASVAGRARL
jgi:myo-inositol 2-dehydrogenase/D-chiro-inositol 1-dehydrogenase